MYKKNTNGIILSLLILGTLLSCEQTSTGTTNEEPDVPGTPDERSGENSLLTFTIERELNEGYMEEYEAVIDQQSVQIDFPDVLDQEQVIATFSISEKAKIFQNGSEITSGQSVISIASGSVITVKAENETESEYTIDVNTYPAIQPNPDINLTTSMHQQNIIKEWSYHWSFDNLGAINLDLDDDGDEDLVVGYYNQHENIAIPMDFFRQVNGDYIKDNSIWSGTRPSQVFTRKPIKQDFNGDGRMDLAYANHGYDYPPFPGEQPTILLNEAGKLREISSGLPDGFYHAGAAGDVDNDGDIDLMMNGHSNYLLINDGAANFTIVEDFMPEYDNMVTSEFYDLNGDGYLDLMDFSDDNEVGKNPEDPNYDFVYTHKIYWGNYTGKYFAHHVTMLPVIEDWGLITDSDLMDIDGDGNVEMLTVRTGDADAAQGYYEGHYLQLHTYKDGELIDITASSFDVSKTQDFSQQIDSWYHWVRFFDHDDDGDMDIIVESQNFFIVYWTNNGSGYFTKTATHVN